MIRILTDSACDLSAQELEHYGITAVPLSIHFGETVYRDGVTLEKDRFYELLRESEEFPKTSQPSPSDFESHFEEAKRADDEVVAVLISSALSGTYQGAQIAKTMADYDKIYLVDSLTATVGERLLLLEAVKLRDAGKSAAEIAEALEALKKRITIWACLDTLEYLYKGGRLSRTAAGIGTLANMKPIITVTGDGNVAVHKKCIGQKRSMEQLVRLTEGKRPDPAYPLFGLYTYDRANCAALAARMAARSASSLWARASSTASEASTNRAAAPRSMSGSRKRAGRFLSQPSGSCVSTSSATRESGSSVSVNDRTSHAASAGAENSAFNTSVGAASGARTRPRKRSPGST